MDAGALNTEIQDDFLNLHVNYLSQLMLALKVIQWPSEPIFFLLVHDLFHFIDACQNDLRLTIAPLPGHLQDLLVKVYLFFAVRYLVHGTIEDKADAVRLALQSFCSPVRYNLLRKQVSVTLPELPKHVRISVVSLLDEGLIGNFAADHQVELGDLTLVHPNLPSRVVDDYLTIILTVRHLLRVEIYCSLLLLAQIFLLLMRGQHLLLGLVLGLDFYSRVGQVGLDRDPGESSRALVRILVLNAQHTLNLMR